MIKPLNNVSNVAFRGSLEDYQEQIKNKKEPRYQLTLSPGSADVPAQKPSLKRGIAGIFKGFNNVAGIATGTVKGLGKGIAFGCLTGAIAKNFKANVITATRESGKTVKTLAFGQFIKGTIGDLWSFVGHALKGIGSALQKAPKDVIKDVVKLPGKYMNYLGKGNRAVKAVAIGVGAVTLGYNIVKAKVQANRKNANVDHSLNLNH